MPLRAPMDLFCQILSLPAFFVPVERANYGEIEVGKTCLRMERWEVVTAGTTTRLALVKWLSRYSKKQRYKLGHWSGPEQETMVSYSVDESVL